MIINGPITRSGSLIDSVANPAKQDSRQSGGSQQNQTSAVAQPAQIISASNVNLSDRVDLRVLKVADATYQQQRALSVYLATEVSSEDSSIQALINITA